MSKILVGKIIAAHGIKGEVKIKAFTEDPKSLGAFGPFTLADGRSIEIVRLKLAKDHLIAALKGIIDRTAAEALRGVELFAAREKLGQDLLLADLVGRDVLHNGSNLGKIDGFQNFGAGELMELDTGLLIPVRFVVNSDDAVTVDLPDGYLDPPERET